MTLLRSLLAFVLLGGAQALSAQAVSFAGSCSGAFSPCDHVTIFTEGERQIVQFTDNSLGYTHILTFAGTPDPQDTAVIHVTEAVRDNHEMPNAAGLCVLTYSAPTKLDAIVCSAPSLSFTVTK